MTATELTTTRTLLAVRRGVVLQQTDQGVTVVAPGWEHTLPVRDVAARDAVLSLVETPATSADLMQSVLDAPVDAMSAAVAMQSLLKRLQLVGALEHVVEVGGEVVARLTTEGGMPVLLTPVPDQQARRLSPLAVATVVDGWVLVQSGVSHLQVALRPECFAVVAAGAPAAHDLAPVADLLHSAGLWLTAAEAARPSTRQWSAAELWMHRRSHESRSNDGYGGGFPMLGVTEPPRFARPEPPAESVVRLPEVDLDRARRDDPPLAEVTESRRSSRRLDPPSLDALAELLYRTVRLRRTALSEHGLEVVDRPYPSGGALHELEVYVVVRETDGLEPGVYRYAAERHCLDVVSTDAQVAGRIAADAGHAIQLEGGPPVTLLLAARFDRLLWKYQTMAYALTLKHVGVVYQTLYLHATAMGLGLCGIGGASTSLLSQTTGVDPLDEGVVGVLALGVPTGAEDDLWGRP